jgi:hypothetical protein
MFRAVWPTEGGNRSLIGVVLRQRGDNLITADGRGQAAGRPPAAKRSPPETRSTSGTAGRLGAGQPGLAAPAAAYRRHIENHIRAGNTPLP